MTSDSTRGWWHRARSVAPAALLALAVVAPRAHAQAQPAAAQGATALSLDEAMQLAERQSESVRIAEAAVLRARGQQVQARSQYLPQINGTGAYQRTLQSQFQALAKQSAPVDTQTGPRLSSICAPDIPAGATAADRAAALAKAQTCSAAGNDLSSVSRIFASPYTMTFTLTGNQTLFSGGRVAAANNVAEAGRRSAEIGLTAAKAQLRLDVAQAYYNAVLANRLVAISESSLVQTERALRQTTLAQQVGNTSEFDLLRARVTRDNQRPVLIQSRSQRDVAVLQLRQLLNLPSGRSLVLTTDLPTPAALPAQQTAVTLPPNNAGAARPTPVAQGGEGLLTVDPAEVLAEDPRVATAVDSALSRADTSGRVRASTRQARENISVQRSLLRQARAQRLPQVSLGSVYQRIAYPSGGAVPLPSGFNQFFPNWTATLQVSLPIFVGGRIHGDELVAEAGLREAEQTAQQVEELSALDAAVTVNQLAQAEAAWLASAGTAEQATRAYQISEVRYREGISTLVELADSRLMLQQSQVNAATAARDVQIARLKLALLRDLPLSSSQSGASSTARQGTGASTTTQQSSTTQSSAQQGAAGAQTAGTAGRTTP